MVSPLNLNSIVIPYGKWLIFSIESITYEFGVNKGIIQYTFPPGKQPDTEEDAVSLGFLTMKTDAVLLRIESSATQDYMELEIVSECS